MHLPGIIGLCFAFGLIGTISAHNLCPNLKCNVGSKSAEDNSMGASPCSSANNAAATTAAPSDGGCPGVPAANSAETLISTSDSLLGGTLTSRKGRIGKFTSGAAGRAAMLSDCKSKGLPCNEPIESDITQPIEELSSASEADLSKCGTQNKGPCNGAVKLDITQPIEEPSNLPEAHLSKCGSQSKGPCNGAVKLDIIQPIEEPSKVPEAHVSTNANSANVQPPIAMPKVEAAGCSAPVCASGASNVIDVPSAQPVATSLGCQRNQKGTCGMPKPAEKQICILGRCIKNANAQTNGEATGTLTQTAGNSAVNVGAGGMHGIAAHQAAGKGLGQTGASSASKIHTEDLLGIESLQSAGRADSFGQSSASFARSNTQTLNGIGHTNSEAEGEAVGYGSSSSSTAARASKCGLAIC